MVWTKLRYIFLCVGGGGLPGTATRLRYRCGLVFRDSLKTSKLRYIFFVCVRVGGFPGTATRLSYRCLVFRDSMKTS
jgi:hypothetical protein